MSATAKAVTSDDLVRTITRHQRVGISAGRMLCRCGWAGSDERLNAHHQHVAGAVIELFRDVFRDALLAADGLDSPELWAALAAVAEALP